MNRKFRYQVILISLFQIVTLPGYSLILHVDKSYSEDSIHHYMILPGTIETLKSKTSFSVLFTELPFDWVESVVEIPLFQLNNKIKLPLGLTLETRLQTIFISNQLRIGPHWYYESGRFSIGAGFDSEFMFGKMSIAGFNNKTWGWSSYPDFTAGYRIKEIAFALNVELTYINSLRISAGNEEISHSRNRFSGTTVSFFVEQPLWKDHMMILGLINNFQKAYFPAWPAFSTFNRTYYIPQFYVGLVL